MKVSITKPDNRLSWRVGRRGMSRTKAIQNAEANVETLRDESLAYIDANLERLSAVLKTDNDPAPSGLAEIYEASDAISGTAANFGLEELGRAAYSFCNLLSYIEDTGTWLEAPAKVHVNAMLILRNGAGAGTPQESLDMVQRLEDLVAFLQRKT